MRWSGLRPLSEMNKMTINKITLDRLSEYQMEAIRKQFSKLELYCFFEITAEKVTGLPYTQNYSYENITFEILPKYTDARFKPALGHLTGLLTKLISDETFGLLEYYNKK